MSQKGTAVVTGAGRGIGRAFTALCAARGYDLALFEVKGEELETSAAAARTQGITVTTRIVDVADESAVKQGAEEVTQEHGPITLLMNNAGVALGGQFLDNDADNFRWLMDINFYGVVNMTRAFLPVMQQAPKAHIINVSSIFGVIAPPGQTAYCASKFAVRGFSESLRHELAGTHVGLTLVHPGGVSTNIAKRARIPASVSAAEREETLQQAAKALRMPPPKAAQIILDAAERGDPRILVGGDARFVAMIQRFFPISYFKILRHVQGLKPQNQKRA